MTKINWIKTKCPICHQEFEYAKGGYEPKTCGNYDCLFKFLHPELYPVPYRDEKNSIK